MPPCTLRRRFAGYRTIRRQANPTSSPAELRRFLVKASAFGAIQRPLALLIGNRDDSHCANDYTAADEAFRECWRARGMSDHNENEKHRRDQRRRRLGILLTCLRIGHSLKPHSICGEPRVKNHRRKAPGSGP